MNDLLDIPELNIKGELIGEENENFDRNTAFTFNEENVTEIISKLDLLIKNNKKQNDKLKILEQKNQYIKTDEYGTHFELGVYANGNELVADDDYKDPSAIQVSNLESEEKWKNLKI